MKKKRFKLSVLAVTILCAFISVMTCNLGTAKAETPYKTYTLDGYGSVEETQTAYLAEKTLNKFGNNFFSAPSDLCVKGDRIYVADTGNKRIVVGDLNGNEILEFGKDTLETPKGVFVTENGDIYVADRDKNAIFQFDADGKLLNTFGKPNSPLYGDDVKFLPIKVVVNDAGIMYVVCESNNNGIVEISPADGGTFLGYFGTNLTRNSFVDIFYRAILTKEQRARMVANIPATPDNLAIDEKGLIYTVTRGDEATTVKRLNIAGTNLIKSVDRFPEVPAAVACGNHDNIYVADQQGYIYEYTNEGELLFVFGGLDDGTQRVGLSTLVSAIGCDENDRIYLLDSDKSRIQVYEPTEFTILLHNALYLYSKGRYTESKEPLTKVLQMNSMFDYANKAMGRAYYQEENYKQALHYARLAYDWNGYSDAYWEVRNNWLQKNIIPLILIIVAFFVIRKIIIDLDRKKGILKGYHAWCDRMGKHKFISNLGYARYFMKHPIDVSYGIAREGRASFTAASFILLIFTVEFIINKYLCGFLLKTVRDGRYELVSDIGTIVVVMFGVTVCHYLVCTINDGEATMKKIYTYFCYSLRPYIIITPIIFVLSHITTANELFLITLAQVVMYTWIIVFMLLSMKEVNNYTAGQTVKVILLTAFTILIMSLLIFIIYVLWAQVFQFFGALFGEVAYRLGY